MSKRKYPVEHQYKTRVIRTFEEYEKKIGIDYGDHPNDFMPPFLLFEAGFEEGDRHE